MIFIPHGILQQQVDGLIYNPGMMTFNGTDAYYSDTTVTANGNKVSAVARVNIASFTGGGSQRILNLTANGGNKLLLSVFASDHADSDRQLKVQLFVQNSSATIVCWLASLTTITDSTDHVIFGAYDGDTGSAQLFVDGLDSDNGSFGNRTLTTGTLGNTITGFGVGAIFSGTGLLAGDCGYAGLSATYLTNPTDFYHPTNGLQELDESGWTEWGAQPLFWNQFGTMDDNKGSAGNMTANGTITGPS